MSTLTIKFANKMNTTNSMILALTVFSAIARIITWQIGVLWKMSAIALIILAAIYVIWRSLNGKQVHFHADGTITFSKQKDVFYQQDYIGVASAWKLHNVYCYGYQIALIPKETLKPALIVYENFASFKKENHDPSQISELRQKIAQFTHLADKGFLGLLSDDEWRYLATNPDKPDMFGNYWQK